MAAPRIVSLAIDAGKVPAEQIKVIAIGIVVSATARDRIERREERIFTFSRGVFCGRLAPYKENVGCPQPHPVIKPHTGSDETCGLFRRDSFWQIAIDPLGACKYLAWGGVENAEAACY